MAEPASTLDAKALLRTADMRPTRQRVALVRLLFGRGDRHVTAEELHREALDADMRMSLATVYNTLHQLTRVGLLRELVVGSGRCYFDTNGTDHQHMFDERSGQLLDIPAGEIRVSGVPAPPAGAEIRRVDVVVRLRAAGPHRPSNLE